MYKSLDDMLLLTYEIMFARTTKAASTCNHAHGVAYENTIKNPQEVISEFEMLKTIAKELKHKVGL